jgi:hypothetical protein
VANVLNAIGIPKFLVVIIADGMGIVIKNIGTPVKLPNINLSALSERVFLKLTLCRTT